MGKRPITYKYMPLEIEIPEKRAAELISAMRERDEIAKAANAQMDAKNLLINVMINARIEIHGGDPDAPRGAVSIQVKDGKHLLVVPDAPAVPVMLYALLLIALIFGLLFVRWPMRDRYAPGGGYFCVLEVCFFGGWVGVSVWHKHQLLLRNQDGSVVIPHVGIWSATALFIDWKWRFWER